MSVMEFTAWNWVFACSSVIFLFLSTISGVEIITEGKSYRFAFPEYIASNCEFDLTVSLATQESDDSMSLYSTYVMATIRVPELSIEDAIALNSQVPTVVPLRARKFSRTTGERNKVIHLDSDFSYEAISVVGRILCTSTRESPRRLGEFLAIPVEYWGRKYVIAAPREIACGYTTTLIAAGEVTEVILTLRIRYIESRGYLEIDGVSITSLQSMMTSSLVVEAGGRREITSKYVDITGSVYESDHPFAVMVGPLNENLTIICQQQQDLFIEQLVPVYAWGNSYYVTESSEQNGTAFDHSYRILSAESDTEVLYKCDFAFSDSICSFSDKETIDKDSQYVDFGFPKGTEVDLVTSSKPIMVMMFTTARLSPGMIGDMAMTQMVPLTHEWPSELILVSRAATGQMVHLFTPDSCLGRLTLSEGGKTYKLPDDTTYRDFPANTTGLIYSSWQTTSLLTAEVPGADCKGVTGYVITDVGQEHEIVGSRPLIWAFVCPIGQYFNESLMECTSNVTSAVSATTTELMTTANEETMTISNTDMMTTTKEETTITTYEESMTTTSTDTMTTTNKETMTTINTDTMTPTNADTMTTTDADPMTITTEETVTATNLVGSQKTTIQSDSAGKHPIQQQPSTDINNIETMTTTGEETMTITNEETMTTTNVDTMTTTNADPMTTTNADPMTITTEETVTATNLMGSQKTTIQSDSAGKHPIQQQPSTDINNIETMTTTGEETMTTSSEEAMATTNEETVTVTRVASQNTTMQARPVTIFPIQQQPTTTPALQQPTTTPALQQPTTTPSHQQPSTSAPTAANYNISDVENGPEHIQCPCRCGANTNRGETFTELKLRVKTETEDVVKQLTVDVTYLGRTRRTYGSAHDNRPSAICLGVSGVMILVGTAVFVIALDSTNIRKIPWLERRGSRRVTPG